MRVGIWGAGYSGQIIGAKFADNAIPVWGTTREETKFPTLKSAEMEPVLFDGTDLSAKLKTALLDTTHLIITIAPPRKESSEQPDALVDPVLTALASHSLRTLAPKLQWIGYLSTVGVYGNHDGAWVDEETPAAPASERSRQRLRAEAEWLMVGEVENVPVGIFRLSGIYGPGRNALATAINGKSRRMIKPGQVFNRIHAADIAKGLYRAAMVKASGIFNITDDKPAPPQDVVTFAHSLLGTQPPEEINFETADISSMARSFYGENKRVSNQKSKAELGLVYSHPDYKTALKKMNDEGNW